MRRLFTAAGIAACALFQIFAATAGAGMSDLWSVNGNGYTGTLKYTYNEQTGVLSGELMGVQINGFLTGRHIVIHRFAGGKKEIWDGWIMDSSQKSQLPSYKDSPFLAGTISIDGQGTFPWYGVKLQPADAPGALPQGAQTEEIDENLPSQSVQTRTPDAAKKAPIIDKGELIRKIWRFERGDGTVLGTNITLKANGEIDGHNHPNETRWGFEQNALVFYDKDENPTTRFTTFAKADGIWVLSGPFLMIDNVVHILRETADISSVESPLTLTKEEITKKTWRFERADGTIVSENVKFLEEGKIEGHTHENEASWDMDENNLVIFTEDGKPSTRFDSFEKQDNRWVLKGPFLLYGHITHVLKEIDDIEKPDEYVLPIEKKDLLSITWRFDQGEGALDPKVINLRADGSIEGHEHPNMSSWGIEGSTLVFYHTSGKPATRFENFRKVDGAWFISGPFLLWGHFSNTLRELK